jgi:HAAS domain-containing protein
VNSTAQDDITAYVEAVRAALSALPPATRDELLEDLPEHLAEVRADGAGSLVDRLGPPESYAAELRATAGFVGGFPDPPVDRYAELRETTLRKLRSADLRIGPLLGYARATDFLALLRPAWWVLRGYLAAMVLAWALDDSGQPMGLLPRIGGSEVVAVLLLAAAIVGSIWVGRRSAAGLAPWPRYALYAGSVVLVLVAIGGFLNADSTARNFGYSDVNYSNPYSNVQDVFVYDEQGRLVTGARLFDQDGQPIRLGNASCYDESDGSEVAVPDGAPYPYCPSNAPFRFRSAPPTTAPASPAPSDGAGGAPTAPSGTPTVTPSGTPTAAPSVTPTASTSPARSR